MEAQLRGVTMTEGGQRDDLMLSLTRDLTLEHLAEVTRDLERVNEEQRRLLVRRNRLLSILRRLDVPRQVLLRVTGLSPQGYHEALKSFEKDDHDRTQRRQLQEVSYLLEKVGEAISPPRVTEE